MKKLIHYSRAGYEGNYSYKSVCGISVKTHQDSEESSIYAKDANCKKCLKTKEYLLDIANDTTTPEGIKRRIYIESDFLHADEFRDAQRTVFDFCKDKKEKCVDRVFSQVLDMAWHDLEKTWKEVKKADEIYATSSFIPLCGNPSMGAPVIFNGMCKRAVSENFTGKSVIILNKLEFISWNYIDKKL